MLLKLIKNNILNQMVDAPSVTSYHLKTCLFYTIEQTSESLWKQENLLFCFQKCLVKLLEWTNSGNCPNYFIPEENMFERKVFDSTEEN